MNTKLTRLTRTGKRPIEFVGNELFCASTKDHNSTRWAKCVIYETDTGKIVVGIGDITCWQGEVSRLTAEVFADRSEAISYVEENCAALAPAAAKALDVSETV